MKLLGRIIAIVLTSIISVLAVLSLVKKLSNRVGAKYITAKNGSGDNNDL